MTEFRSLAQVDELTGLCNRRGFMTLAEQQLRFAERRQKDLLLLYADVDSSSGSTTRMATTRATWLSRRPETCWGVLFGPRT